MFKKADLDVDLAEGQLPPKELVQLAKVATIVKARFAQAPERVPADERDAGIAGPAGGLAQVPELHRGYTRKRDV